MFNTGSTPPQTLSLLLVSMTLLALGCSETGLQRLPAPDPPPLRFLDARPPVFDPPQGTVEPTIPPEKTPPQDPPQDPPETTPPEIISGCDSPDATAIWDGGEIWVATNGAMERTGTVTVSDEGLFDVYSAFSAESGDTQWNESSFYRFENEIAPEGKSHQSNCSEDWVVQDVDNFEAWESGDYLYIGTFLLVEGENTMLMSHYCLLFEEGECQEFHFEEEPSSTCPSSNPNSAHFSGELCLLLSSNDPN